MNNITGLTIRSSFLEVIQRNLALVRYSSITEEIRKITDTHTKNRIFCPIKSCMNST